MAAAATKVGENLSYKVVGSKLVIELDLSYRASDAPPPGKKMIRVASSGGFTELACTAGDDGQNVRLSLNAGVYPPR